MKDNLNILQKKINIKFKNLKYLKKSITHKSYNPTDNYEKLEFLGDRILGFVISKKLIEMYPKEKEGILDKKLASLVNKNKCLEIAKKIDLEKFILVGNKSSNTITFAFSWGGTSSSKKVFNDLPPNGIDLLPFWSINAIAIK